MEIRFSPTEKDWQATIRASREFGWGWAAFQFLLSFVPLFLVGAILEGYGFSAMAWSCIGLSVVIAFAGYEVPRYKLKQMFRASPLVKGEWVVTINDEGIEVIYPHMSARYEWRALRQFREINGLFMLRSPRRVVCWVPKEAMSGPQVDELRQILKTRLPTHSSDRQVDPV